MRASKRKIWQVVALTDKGEEKIAYSGLTKREARAAAGELPWFQNIVHAYVEKMPSFVDKDNEEFWDNFWQATLWVFCGAAAMQLIMLGFGVI